MPAFPTEVTGLYRKSPGHQVFSHFLRFIYSKGRVVESSPVPCFTPQLATTTRPKPGAWNSLLVSHTRAAGRGILCCSPMCISRELDQQQSCWDSNPGSDTGCRCPKQWLTSASAPSPKCMFCVYIYIKKKPCPE